jgi:hypothetical protein
MVTGIEFFLTQCVQDKSKHAKGWEWYVIDSERLQQDILHVLLNNSQEFSKSLFGAPCECSRQPNGGTFDLLIKLQNGPEIYVEIKSDQKWTQKDKQIAFMRQRPNAKCALFLFSHQAVLIEDSELQDIEGGQFFKVSYNQLYKALDAIKAEIKPSPGFTEFASGYRLALQEQEKRTVFAAPI